MTLARLFGKFAAGTFFSGAAGDGRRRRCRCGREEGLVAKRAMGEGKCAAMTGKSMNVWVGTVALTALMSLTACAGTPSEAPPRPPAGDPVLSVAWLPPCAQPSAPAFTVEVFADGSVRYLGDQPAKELGERRSKIAVSDVRRLAQSARAVAKGSVGASVKLQGERPYCLEVTLREAGTVSHAKVANDTQGARHLIRTLDEVVRPEQWVCPMRGSRTASDVRFQELPFCGGYRARADLSYSIFDDKGCVHYGGRVYRHEMYSEASYVTAEGKTVFLADRFHPLTARQFRALIGAAKRAHLPRSDLQERGEPAYRDYFGGSEQDLRAFWKTLQEVAPTAPVASVPTTARCNTDYPWPGSLTLREEWGPASN
jgi:hypothetical protein